MAKILFVADNAKTVSSWSEILVLGGHTVDVAITGDEALKRSMSGAPDLIVIDEDDTASETIKKHLKQEHKTNLIPVVSIKAADITRADVVLKKINESLRKKKILIADDDRQMAEILKSILESKNYEIKIAFDGAETLKEIKAWKPHLIVLDIMLPVIDGFHICQSINEEHSENPKPKILIISGRESDWDKNLGKACGAEDYLVKPFDNIFFVKKVQEILSRPDSIKQ